MTHAHYLASLGKSYLKEVFTSGEGIVVKNVHSILYIGVTNARFVHERLLCNAADLLSRGRLVCYILEFSVKRADTGDIDLTIQILFIA